MPCSSASSLRGLVASSSCSSDRSASSASRWELTELYSPTAIDAAPATRAAMPVVRSTERLTSAAATPTRRLAVDSSPSLAPRTAARSHPMRPTAWRSWWGRRRTRVRGTATMVGPRAMAIIDSSLPRWDVTDVYPSLQDRELASARERLGADLVRLVQLYDAHGVGEVAAHDPTAADVAAAEELITETNAVERQFEL